MRGLSGDPEVVVIGAGAAGVGAGLALRRIGIPFLILEAKDRIGGRAFTDTTSLGALWDHGCHWFHSADRNPLRQLADRIGHGYHPVQRGATAPMFKDGRWDFQGTARLRVWGKLDEIAAADSDVPVSAFIQDDDPLKPVFRHWVSLMTSADPEDASALDYSRYDDSHVNLPVREGYGRLIARLGQGLPIRLSSPVTGVARTARGCEIETQNGTIKARAAVLTASMNVLRSNAVRYSPPLPLELEAALHDVPCGYYEKIAIAFDGNPFGDFDAPFCDISDPAGSLPMNIEVAPFGRPLAIGHVAGSRARELAREGKPAMIGLLKEKLLAAFGNELGKRMAKGETTNWTNDPFIAGGYSYARAGKAAARDALIAADTAPLFFAGEAFHPFWSATAHGAYLTGIEAAHRAARHLGRGVAPPDPLWLPEDTRVPAS